MNRKPCRLIGLFAFCLGAISGSQTLHAQSSNAPALSLSPGAPPALTVTGTPGASYQVQFASQLTAPNQWTALTNILLSNSAYLLQDPAAASNAIRFYRALLLSGPSNGFAGFSPAQLSPGESYQFTSVSAFITNIQTLIMNSTTDGVWIGSSGNPIQPFSPVTLQFTQVDPLTISLAVIFPAGNNPSPTTNTYLMVFSSASAGLYQESTGFPGASIGTFIRNASLINQTPVPPQLSAGEIWQITTTANVSTTFQTLVVESATNAWSIIPATGPGSSMFSAATAQFTPEGPYAGSLVIITPPVGASPTPATNAYLVEFTTTNSGVIVGPTNSPFLATGAFVRDTSLVGKTVAPAQLTVGEKYQTLITNGSNPALQYLFADSLTNDWWVIPGNSAASSIFPATAQFTQLGPLSGDLTVVIPPTTQQNPVITSNNYLLVFTATNSGAIALVTDGPTPSTSLGTFVRDTSLVGQNLVPAQLSPGATCQFTFFGFGVGVQTLSTASATSGLWQTMGSGFNDGLTTNGLQYTPMSPFSATLSVTPAPNQNPPSPSGSTNFYLLLFTAPGTGAFQVTTIPSAPSFVTADAFVFSTNLVGKTFSPPQLTAGESFQFAVTNGGIGTISETLVIDSLTNSIWYYNDGGPQSGLYNVSLQYSPLGPLGASLGVVFPVSTIYPSGATNSFLLLFGSNTNGQFQSVNPPSATQLGTFTHATP